MPEAGGTKVACVGCGCRNLVRNFAVLTAFGEVCDSDAGVAGALAGEFKVPVRLWPEILADSAIAGVAIAAPAVLHATLARGAARRQARLCREAAGA